MTVRFPAGFSSGFRGTGPSSIQARYTMNHGAVVGITRIGSFTTSKKGVRVSMKKGFISVIHDTTVPT